MVRVATLLSHAIVPNGCEKTVAYLNLDERFFDWQHAFEDLYYFFEDKENHHIRELKEKEDFYTKHPSQFVQKEG
jgi:methionyl-tRNA synthetase